MTHTIQSAIKKWPVSVAVASALVGFPITFSNHQEATQIRVVSPTYQDVESTVVTTGTVIPEQRFEARASASGSIERIYVHVGDTVRPGQLLVKMKDPFAFSRVSAARAALSSIKVSNENVRNNGSREDRINFAVERTRAVGELEAAKAFLNSLEELKKDGSASEAEVLSGKQRLASAEAVLNAIKQRDTSRYSEADLASWKARMAEAKASLAAEQENLANVNITSPIAGTVYLIPISEYDFVSAGTSLLEVGNLTRMEIRASFDEPDIGQLAVGQPVRVTWEGRPNQVWRGRIEKVPLAVTTAGVRRVGTSTITLEGTQGSLPADTTVTVTVITAKRRQVLTIPREAWHANGSESFVYRVRNGVLSKIPVRAGVVNLNEVEISKGLTPIDVIAVGALSNEELHEDLRVEAASK